MKIFNQPFDMNAFLQRQIDAAAAMTYNELAQVLESKNPKTGKLYTLKDLNVFKLQNEGTGMLEDGLFATRDWIKIRPTATSRCGSSRRPIRAGSTAATTCRSARTSCQERHRAPRRAPALADERDQQAHLAEHRRDRRHGPGGVQADGRDRAEVQGDQEAATRTRRTTRRSRRRRSQYLKNHVKGIDVNGKSYKPISVTLKAGGK